MRGCSLVGRALPLHGRGQGFESPHLHQRENYSIPLFGPFVQAGGMVTIAEGETPVPIPNTEVKPSSSYDTVWATAWENRTLPFHPPV